MKRHRPRPQSRAGLRRPRPRPRRRTSPPPDGVRVAAPPLLPSARPQSRLMAPQHEPKNNRALAAGGVIIAFPYIFWELWRFVKPALSDKEKKYAKGSIFWVSLPPGILFVIGSFLVAESPRWLFRRGNKDAALTALLSLLASALPPAPAAARPSAPAASMVRRSLLAMSARAC